MPVPISCSRMYAFIFGLGRGGAEQVAYTRGYEGHIAGDVAMAAGAWHDGAGGRGLTEPGMGLSGSDTRVILAVQHHERNIERVFANIFVVADQCEVGAQHVQEQRVDPIIAPGGFEVRECVGEHLVAQQRIYLVDGIGLQTGRGRETERNGHGLMDVLQGVGELEGEHAPHAVSEESIWLVEQ
ncbi:hypothetical protein FGG08_007674, partial [Glutinoglossum americanum]